ncbi:MAG: hypothetical protein EAX96_02570 [Candidatus Lokiarchaeota archaeon]|nr:hypothetical protein [Candidatus Lokiarchaeota archaeon]
MPNGIVVLGWRDDIGAYLLAQHPHDFSLSVDNVMSIYNVHRQNSLEPNFGYLSTKDLKVASFFTGMKTTRFLGPAPNFTVGILLQKDENAISFKKMIESVTTNYIVGELINILPNALDKIPEARGVFLLQKKHDTKPYLPTDMTNFKKEVEITQPMLDQIYEKASKKNDPHYFSIKIEDLKIYGFFSGTGDKFVALKDTAICFAFPKTFSDDRTMEQAMPSLAFEMLMKFSTTLSEGLVKVNEAELNSIMKEFAPEELKQADDAEEVDISTILETIELKDEVNVLEQEVETLKQETEKRQEMLEGTSEAIEHLVEQVTKFQNEIIEKNEELKLERKLLAETNLKLQDKENQIIKLMNIIRSLRRYVSY